MIFGIYHIIWIICILALFLAILFCFKRAGTRRNRRTLEQPSSYLVVDMNGNVSHQPVYPPTYQPPPTEQQQHPHASNLPVYRPPTDSLEPPPPAYNEHRKDRVPNV